MKTLFLLLLISSNAIGKELTSSDVTNCKIDQKDCTHEMVKSAYNTIQENNLKIQNLEMRIQELTLNNSDKKAASVKSKSKAPITLEELKKGMKDLSKDTNKWQVGVRYEKIQYSPTKDEISKNKLNPKKKSKDEEDLNLEPVYEPRTISEDLKFIKIGNELKTKDLEIPLDKIGVKCFLSNKEQGKEAKFVNPILKCFDQKSNLTIRQFSGDKCVEAFPYHIGETTVSLSKDVNEYTETYLLSVMCTQSEFRE